MNKKILIIDDNLDDTEIMTRHLKEAGYQNILTAANGKSGIKLAEDEKPNLVILDTLLPDVDGFEVCRSLKSSERINSHVVMLTGAVDAVDAKKARKAGTDDYVVKTSDCAALICAVNSLFKG